ncbi:DUF5074 domain-containing protein [uncultured Flavobacterium sp.]|uniref:DUF5074 domain-containing protein n=1 Tax=uncultured Flavobacterium sp. TaxID=165435 RepID=UPI0025DEF481|nr:DUF5074 domain-containing protein [uncultured Flavobacterium sp.]
MKKNYNLFTIFLSLAFYVSSFAQTGFTNGVFVLNEGGFGLENASVSFIAQDMTLQNNIFATVNPTQGSLGDTAQSIAMNGDYLYVVNNGSEDIKVINSTTFQYVTTISNGVAYPRYIAFYGGKAYVTNWGTGGPNDHYVAVYNLADNTLITTIPTGSGIERILEINGKLYVAHQGGYGYGNTISVIDPATNTITSTINVSYVPNSMVEKDGFLYVLCGGIPSWAQPPVFETFGALLKINIATNAVVSQIDFPNMHPSNLKLDGNDLYYTVDSHIFKTSVTAATLPTTPLIDLEPQGVYGIYGMDIIDNKIFIGDALGYITDGKTYVYSTSGTLLNTYTVGFLPNAFLKSKQAPLSTGDFTKTAVSIYPNPASGVFFLTTDKNAKVNLYDISGRLVKTQNYTANGIDVSSLNSGVYMAEIIIDETREVQKIIIK